MFVNHVLRTLMKINKNKRKEIHVKKKNNKYLVSLFNGISTILGYLMPTSF